MNARCGAPGAIIAPGWTRLRSAVSRESAYLPLSPDNTLPSTLACELLVRCDVAGIVAGLRVGRDIDVALNVGDSVRGLLSKSGVDVDALFAKVASGAQVRFEVRGAAGTAPLRCSAVLGGEGFIEISGHALPASLEGAHDQLAALSDELVAVRRLLAAKAQDCVRQVALVEAAAREIDESNRGIIALHNELQDQTAFDVLDVLKADPSTRNIPVIINTAEVLEADAREALGKVVDTVMSKTELSKELAIHRIRDALHKAWVGKSLP